MTRVNFLRHAGWVGPEDLNQTLNIIGVGATGSNIGLLAAKMGFHKFRVWDQDIVEAHNLPNQAYDVGHVGGLKVDAFKDVLTRFNPAITVEVNPKFFLAADAADVEGPVILTVDTMKARKEIGEALTLKMSVPLIMETRVGFDYAEVYRLNPMDPEEMDTWVGMLKRDEDIPAGPCNLVICSTLVGLVSAHTTHMLCGYFAAQRAGQTWGAPKKTMISLNTKLEAWNIE